MTLAHSEIKRRIEEEKLLEAVELQHVEGAGVDLRAKEFYELKTGGKLGVKERTLPKIGKIEGKVVALQPQEYVLVQTMERVNMPLDLCAWMRHRSTLQRCGVALFTALIDPGYKGTLTFGMKNFSEFEFEIEKGARVGQIIFEELEGESEEYKGRYQGGKNV